MLWKPAALALLSSNFEPADRVLGHLTEHTGGGQFHAAFRVDEEVPRDDDSPRPVSSPG